MILKKYGFWYFLSGIAAAITLPIALLMLSVGLVTFDRDYYFKEYIKFEVGKTQALSSPELRLITGHVLGYLGGREKNLDFTVPRDAGMGRDFFSDRDKAHMVDVKKIYDLLKLLGIFSGGILFLSLFVILRTPAFKEDIHRFLGTGAILGILPFIVLGILMKVDFTKYFTVFHQMFFKNDLWLLDPAVDNLVNIFPEQFFLDMAIRILCGYVIGLLAVIVLSLSTIGKIRRDIV